MLVLDEDKQYILLLHIRGQKTEKGVMSVACTLDYRLAQNRGIEPGDTLTVKVIDHARSKVQAENV